MTNSLYAVYSTLTKRYSAVLTYANDATCKYEISHNKGYDRTLEIKRVGMIDIETGVIDPCPPVAIEIPVVDENQPPIDAIEKELAR